MRLADLLAMSLAALWQQKVRTLLTMFGVLIGTFTLVSSISVGRGVYEATMRQLRQGNQLRQIQVYPGYGQVEKRIPRAELEVKGPMSDAKRARIRKMIIRDWTRRHPELPQVPLDRGRLQALAALDHVEAVTPFIHRQARAVLGNRSRLVTATAADPTTAPSAAASSRGSTSRRPTAARSWSTSTSSTCGASPASSRWKTSWGGSCAWSTARPGGRCPPSWNCSSPAGSA